MKRLVIFDLDGTLLNTISDLGEACNYALAKLGLPQHKVEEYNKMVGNGFRKLIERSAPQADPETVNKLVKLSRDYYDSHCMEHTRPYPGIPELLQQLNAEGVKLAVASNKYQAAVDTIVSHYFPEIPFVAVEGQREGRPIKPDPAIIDSILKESHETKEDTVMIGDSLPDIQTAKNAGIPCIAVTWGFSPEAELREAHPFKIVSTTAEILDILNRK